MVTWPSGKARVCKTLIHQFKSGRHLQNIPGSFGFRDFLFLSSLILEKHSSAHFCGIAGALPGVSSFAPGRCSSSASAAIQQQRLAGAESTTAVDYVLLKNALLSPVYAYRDSRTQLEKAIVAYIDYYYNRRIKCKLNGLRPVQYRIQTV